MYTFVRIVRKDTDEYGTWFFKPKSLDNINEHWKICCSPEISKTIRERVQHLLKTGMAGHPTTDFGWGVDTLCSVYNLTYVEGCVNIEHQAYRNRINDFEKGREIYLAQGMTVYMLDERFFEIAETCEKENLCYPERKNWTIDDVRYMQWNMFGNTGEHWYAKIGKYDIRDKKGNMKWDTKKEAENAAKWFLKNKM